MPIAREMRNKPTEAEKLLWLQLRNNQLLGLKFRRQFSIERFIVDFYCAEARLVIEVDGQIHQYQKEEDEIRRQFIETKGLKILRFSNDDVLNNTETVLDRISSIVPLRRRRGMKG